MRGLSGVTALAVLFAGLTFGSVAVVRAEDSTTVRQVTGYPQVSPWSSDDRLYCLKVNPSCGRDPWWAEWTEVQDGQLVQFSASGLVAEARFIEAVNLLWQWSEGKFLVSEAARHRVTVRAGGPDSERAAFASYHSGSRLIMISSAYVETSTWMVADMLAHELRHAADHRAEVHQGSGRSDYCASEQRAYQVERRFLIWLTRDLVRQSIPMDRIRQRLSPADRTLAENLVRIGSAANPDELARRDYQVSCGTRP